MGRPRKDIPAEVDISTTNSGQVAPQVGVSERTLQRRKAELKKTSINFGFVPDSGDANPVSPQEKGQFETQEEKPQVDYRQMADNVVLMIDTVCSFIPLVLKDLEYTRMSPSERSSIVNSLQSETQILDMIGQNGMMSHIMGFGMLGIIIFKNFKRKPKSAEELEKKRMEKEAKNLQLNAKELNRQRALAELQRQKAEENIVQIEEVVENVPETTTEKPKLPPNAEFIDGSLIIKDENTGEVYKPALSEEMIREFERENLKPSS